MSDELKVSKANNYLVLQQPESIRVAKVNNYLVLQEPSKLKVAKANVYLVLQSQASMKVGKANVYLVLKGEGDTRISKANAYLVLLHPPCVITFQSLSVTDRSVTLYWITESPSAYEISFGKTTSYGTIYRNTTLATDFSRTISGLSANTEYHFKIRCYNDTGSEEYEDIGFRTDESYSIPILSIIGSGHSYDGREDDEPQIWSINQGRQSRGTQNKHTPCGHWHVKEDVVAPVLSTPSPPTGVLLDNARVGPYWNKVSGQFFAFMRSATDDKRCHLWYTSDYGISWARADIANEPVTAATISGYDSCHKGNYIHCVTGEDSIGRVAYSKFNLSTLKFDVINETVVTGKTLLTGCSIEVRNPGGEPAIAFQARNIKDYGYITIRISGSWIAPIEVQGGMDYYSIARIFPGHSNRIHLNAVHGNNLSDWAERAVTVYPSGTISEEKVVGVLGVVADGHNIVSYPAAHNSSIWIRDPEGCYVRIFLYSIANPFMEYMYDRDSFAETKYRVSFTYNGSSGQPAHCGFEYNNMPSGFPGICTGSGGPTNVYACVADLWGAGPRVWKNSGRVWTYVDWAPGIVASSVESNAQALVGNFFRLEDGKDYVAYFMGSHETNEFPVYRLLRVDDLPYSGIDIMTPSGRTHTW